MSTKIYGGTRYPVAIGAERYARMLGKAVRPVHEQLVAEAAGRLVHARVLAQLSGRPDVPVDAADLADIPEIEGAPAGRDWLKITHFLNDVDAVIKLASDSPQRMKPAFALEFSVSFVADPDGGQWGYAQAFCSNPRLAQVWAGLPGVQEYGYWNNTDGPEDVTEADWDERGRVWWRVLGLEPWASVGIHFEPVRPSAFLLSVTRRRWFMAAAARGFALQESERVESLARSRSESNRIMVSGLLTRLGTPTTPQDIADQQAVEATEFAARFR